jgi:transposase-like protein
MKKVASDKSDIVAELPVACADEKAAVEFMEAKRWGESPACPHCGAVGECYQMRDRKTGERNKRFLWRCTCKRQFTVRVGTVFEDSRIPLRFWCYAFWAACASKKGVSALQIKRQTGLSYKSALFMMHRIRFAMADDPAPSAPLKGDVEADETWVGGKLTNKSWKERHENRPTTYSNKAPVMALVERGGRLQAFTVPSVTASNVARVLRERVDKSVRLITDEGGHYRKIGPEFEGGHETVIHSAFEYSRDGISVNTAEAFFALLKRGINGTFHAVSRKHLHRYVSEFEFRWNARGLDDGERTVKAIKQAEGKRLTYLGPKAK